MGVTMRVINFAQWIQKGFLSYIIFGEKTHCGESYSSQFLSNMANPFVSKDDASSVYNRSPDSPKFSSQGEVVPFRFSLPEINTLNHQLAMSLGTSMALETKDIRAH